MAEVFARYPKPRLKPFMVEVFKAWGCRVDSGHGKVEVHLTRALRKRFGKSKLTLLLARSSDPAAAEGELMVPGNPIYRSVLELAAEKGRVGRGFARAPKRRRNPATAARAVRRALKPGKTEFRVLAREEVYNPVGLFHFSISYGVPEVPDEIRSVAWDVVAGDVADTDPFKPGGLSLEPDPDPGIEVVDNGDSEAMFDGVIDALERDISRKVRRTEAKAKRQLDREGARIESFYRRMIQEEKSRRRSRQDGDVELSRKIELYQLDWKRKLTEATERLRPRIGVRLFSIEQAYLPRRRTLLIMPESADPERECFYDYVTGGVVGPACDVCGHRSLKPVLCRSGHLCCSECVAVCKVCGKPFCRQCWAEHRKRGRRRRGAEPAKPAAMEMDPVCAAEQGNQRRLN